jgi:hypothetical protein
VAERLRAPWTAKAAGGTRHLLFAFCDHYEPLWKLAAGSAAAQETGEARVAAWHRDYPIMAAPFRDADGYPPRHTFFFPGEQYAPSYLDHLADLVRRDLGEVELHLHHDGDTRETLRRDLVRYLGELAAHGHLAREPDGRLRYAFIHGNWCLANARNDGRWCGVAEELPLLFETGCYADYTFPSAPDECQPQIVNQIYWPDGDLSRRRAYEQGVRARVGGDAGRGRGDRILMIQGPLAPALQKAEGRRVPRLRIENAAVTAADPATASRIRTWVDQQIHVEGRPEWVFVKVHTHGAPEKQAASLLGAGGQALHRELTTRYNDGRKWALHYVTAREMFNIAMAAVDGQSGDPGAFRNYVLAPPPAAARA